MFKWKFYFKRIELRRCTKSLLSRFNNKPSGKKTIKAFTFFGLYKNITASLILNIIYLFLIVR